MAQQATTVHDISIQVVETRALIHASEKEWCKVEQVGSNVWIYSFEPRKGLPEPLKKIFPSATLGSPKLRVQQINNNLTITIQEFRAPIHVDIYAYGRLLWRNVGGLRRLHVGDTTTLEIPTVPTPPITPPAPPTVVPTPVPITPPTDRLSTLLSELLDELRNLKVLLNNIFATQTKLPDSADRIEINTSNTDWRSLQYELKPKGRVYLGIWIEDVGGGFQYYFERRGRKTCEFTAVKDSTWNLEFDNIYVKGSGTSGTGKIVYWWREFL